MHGSYLQGMETKRYHPAPHIQSRRTDPTYKEWKRSCEALGGRVALRTDPTYKEWKPGDGLVAGFTGSSHGSYLQGMETA